MISYLRSHIRWALIIWLFVMSAVSYLDRINISIASHFIMEEYHFNHVQLGYVFSAFVLGYGVFQAPAGRFADRYGTRLAITVAAIWWAVFTSLATAVPRSITGALAAFILVRFMLGAGESVIYPASNRMVASWIPEKERGRANGVIFAGVGAGAGITPPLITFIMLRGGWKLSFWVSALLGIVAGIVWFVLARDTPDEHPGISAQEREVIRSGMRDEHQATNVLPWRKILSNKDMMLVCYSYFCFGYVAYIFFSWFYIYLSAVKGMDLRESSWFGMLPFVAMAVSSPLGGVISDYVTRRYGPRWGRCGVAIAGMGFSALFVALGSVVASTRLASLVLAGGAGALYFTLCAFWSVTADFAGKSAGAASGVMNTGCQISGALTSTLTPIVAAHFGWTASFGVAAALCATGALAWFLVDPSTKLTSGEAVC